MVLQIKFSIQQPSIPNCANGDAIKVNIGFAQWSK